jgi:hypothetical protein
MMQKMVYATGEDVYTKLHQPLQQTRHQPVMAYFNVNWHGFRAQWVEG